LSANRFLAPSLNKFFTLERAGDAGDDGERGGNRESATALLVTAGGGASGDGGGGGFSDMVFFDYFFVAPMQFFSERGRENKEESKNLNVP
jgi:hypothetical protein